MKVKGNNDKEGSTEFCFKVQDCIEGMRQLPDESVDIVVTSPPYNVGVRYNSYNDRRSHADYLEWATTWAKEIKRVLKPNGSFFLNVGSVPSNPMLPHDLVVELCKTFKLQNTFHWIKSITVLGNAGHLSLGHFKPVNSRRFVNDCHEFVFHLTKAGTTPLDRLSLGVPYADKSNIKRWTHAKGRDLRCRGNIWFIPHETSRSPRTQKLHPATFPTQLAMNCVKIHGSTPEIVMLDPFMGIGHSALAAKECGIQKFIGFDIDHKYISVAKGSVNFDNRPTRHGGQEGGEGASDGCG